MHRCEKIHNSPVGAGIVFILGGGMTREGKKWRTTHFDEGDTKGALGDFLRVEASYALYKKDPEIRFIILGGKGQYSGIKDAPTVSALMQGELVALGVPLCSIVIEERSGTTWQQLVALRDLVPQKEVAGILSNRYHLRRVAALILREPTLSKLYAKREITLLSAEEVLIEDDLRAWKPVIDAAYATEAMKERIRLEGEGVRQIRNGTYQLK